MWISATSVLHGSFISLPENDKMTESNIKYCICQMFNSEQTLQKLREIKYKYTNYCLYIYILLRVLFTPYLFCKTTSVQTPIVATM